MRNNLPWASHAQAEPVALRRKAREGTLFWLRLNNRSGPKTAFMESGLGSNLTEQYSAEVLSGDNTGNSGVRTSGHRANNTVA
jgi:hypothetical protein